MSQNSITVGSSADSKLTRVDWETSMTVHARMIARKVQKSCFMGFFQCLRQPSSASELIQFSLWCFLKLSIGNSTKPQTLLAFPWTILMIFSHLLLRGQTFQLFLSRWRPQTHISRVFRCNSTSRMFKRNLRRCTSTPLNNHWVQMKRRFILRSLGILKKSVRTGLKDKLRKWIRR